MMTLPFGWSENKWLLIIGNMFLGVLCIVLFHTNVLPLDMVDFFFFTFIGFLVALYRPGWMFLLFIGMLPYEIVSIAPPLFGAEMRPYQWLLVLIFGALLVRFLLKRFPLPPFRFDFWDATLVVFGFSAFVSALASEESGVAFRFSIILVSFLLLYFICRLFVRSVDDARMLLPFFLSSLLVVCVYALWQNIAFFDGRESLQVMAGRPNALFSEPDWLGGYVAVFVVALVSLIVSPTLLSRYASIRVLRTIFSRFLFFSVLTLVLTVSRSAWLAAGIGTTLALFFFAWQRGVFGALYWKNRQVLKRATHVFLFIALPIFLALACIAVFQLTPFDVFDRGKSISSGEQKITIACDQEQAVPEKISSLEVLSEYGCRHINLEDIATEQAEGYFVTETYRDDPNVHIRGDIYRKVFDILKEHWLFGIGFGSVSIYLGTDARGAGLNASNMFLEVWLGSGLVGFLAFSVFWFWLGGRFCFSAFNNASPAALLFSSVWVAATVFNLFNSGLLLGWLFVLLAFLTLPHREPYGNA